MIQRIQTIFFFLVAAGYGALFGVPFASTDKVVNGLFTDQLYSLSDNIILQILAGLGILLAVAAIFMYRNRKNQIKTGYGLATISIILPVVAILIYANEKADFSTVMVEDQAGLYIPIGILIFALLGVRFVKKDDKLVQSMDRLR